MAEPVVRKDRVQPIVEPWGSLSWLVSGAMGNSSKLTVGRVVIRPGCANPRHCHETSEEILHLVSGTLEHSFGSERFAMSAGDSIAVPAGVYHNAKNAGTVDAEMVVTFATPRRTITLE